MVKSYCSKNGFVKTDAYANKMYNQATNMLPVRSFQIWLPDKKEHTLENFL